MVFTILQYIWVLFASSAGVGKLRDIFCNTEQYFSIYKSLFETALGRGHPQQKLSRIDGINIIKHQDIGVL